MSHPTFYKHSQSGKNIPVNLMRHTDDQPTEKKYTGNNSPEYQAECAVILAAKNESLAFNIWPVKKSPLSFNNRYITTILTLLTGYNPLNYNTHKEYLNHMFMVAKSQGYKFVEYSDKVENLTHSDHIQFIHIGN